MGRTDRGIMKLLTSKQAAESSADGKGWWWGCCQIRPRARQPARLLVDAEKKASVWGGLEARLQPFMWAISKSWPRFSRSLVSKLYITYRSSISLKFWRDLHHIFILVNRWVSAFTASPWGLRKPWTQQGPFILPQRAVVIKFKTYTHQCNSAHRKWNHATSIIARLGLCCVCVIVWLLPAICLLPKTTTKAAPNVVWGYEGWMETTKEDRDVCRGLLRRRIILKRSHQVWSCTFTCGVTHTLKLCEHREICLRNQLRWTKDQLSWQHMTLKLS